MVFFASSNIYVEQMVKNNFYNERLPFPTKLVQLQATTIEVYVIPQNKKAEVLKRLYPFVPIPSLEDEMIDIHEDKKFLVKEFCATREGNLNLLVSPYYFKSGGTVIDWWPADCDE